MIPVRAESLFINAAVRTRWRLFKWIFVILFLYFFGSEIYDSYTLVGLASWYGGKDHGDKTASGEIYDQFELTAAHRRLSFGTRVKVTRLSNNKEVIVRINDRGPYVPGRVIDLSLTAARELGMVRKGVTKVKLEILSVD